MSGRILVNDQNSHHALRKMAGIGLYLKQQQRDRGKVVYDNPMELLELLSSSKSLKVFHPDLYERYAFEQNLSFESCLAKATAVASARCEVERPWNLSLDRVAELESDLSTKVERLE